MNKDFAQFEKSLIQMGINPLRGAQAEATLPPLPASDPLSLQKNTFNGFYKVGARDFWQHSEVTHHEVQEFSHCEHYFVEHGRRVQCQKCHAGWIVTDSFSVQDGKLFDGATQLSFAP